MINKIGISIVCALLVMSILVPISLYARSVSETLEKIEKAEIKDETAITATQNVMGSIITVAQVVGTGIAVIMLIFLAMKYMMASAGDKADIKKHAVIYIIGAIIIFTVPNILAIIADFANKNINQ